MTEKKAEKSDCKENKHKTDTSDQLKKKYGSFNWILKAYHFIIVSIIRVRKKNQLFTYVSNPKKKHRRIPT